MNTISPGKKNEKIERLEANLNEFVNYIEDLFNFLPVPLCDLSPTFYIIQVNRSLEKLFGCDALEIIGENIKKYFKEKEKIKEIISQISSKEKILENQELTLLGKGEEKIVNTFWARREKGGEIRGYFLAMIEITELKRLHQEMERKIEERTRELKEKLEELEKFQKISLRRELKMIELKEKIASLEEEIETLRKEKSQGEENKSFNISNA